MRASKVEAKLKINPLVPHEHGATGLPLSLLLESFWALVTKHKKKRSKSRLLFWKESPLQVLSDFLPIELNEYVDEIVLKYSIYSYISRTIYAPIFSP